MKQQNNNATTVNAMTASCKVYFSTLQELTVKALKGPVCHLGICICINVRNYLSYDTMWNYVKSFLSTYVKL